MEGHKTYTREKIVLVIYMGLYATSMMGINLFIPQILISLIQQQHPEYSKDKIEGLASTYKSFMDGINALVGLIVLPILGGISDVVGRKKMMIVGISCFGCYTVAMAFSYHFKLLWLVYAASCFSFSMINQICALSYMTEISSDEKDRAKNFGLILAGFMLGFIGGSLIMGYVSEKYGIYVGFYSVFGCTVVTLLFLLFVFHEDSPYYHSRHERKFQLSKSNPFTSLRLILGLNPYVSTIAIVYALNFIGFSDSMASGFLYTQNRYSWGTLMNGVQGAVGGVSSMLWQGVGLGLLLKCISRERVLMMTFIGAACIHWLMGYAPVGWIYMTAGALGGFAAISIPMMQALISQKLPKEKQGIAFGGLSSMGAIATFVGAFLSENLFSLCLAHENKYFTCPGTAFFVCGIILFINGIICGILFYKYPATIEIMEIKIRSEEEALLPNGADENSIN